MDNIKIADCTCGDGIGALAWSFGKFSLQDIIYKLSQTQVDIIELGILEDSKQAHKHTFKFRNIKELRKQLAVCFPDNSIQYALTIADIHKFQLDSLEEKQGNGICYIMIHIGRDEWEQGLQYCAAVQKKGYRVLLVTECISYDTEEFNKQIEDVNALSPAGFSIKDDFGVLGMQKLSHVWKLADENLSPQIALGYCTNYQETYDMETLFQILLEIAPKRQTIISASVCGIGNRIGGLHTEVILSKLKEAGNCRDYQIEQVFVLYDKYFKWVDASFWKKKFLLYTSAAMNRVNSAYAYYYGIEKKIGVYHVNEVLKKLPQKQKRKFNKKAADFYLRQHDEDYWRKRLCVIILTANRPEAIRCWIQKQGKQFQRLGIPLIIYDSSSDQKTEQIVRQYVQKGLRLLHYERYHGIYNGVSIDEKAISAYEKYAKEYEYIWEFRDGLILNLPAFLEDIDELLLDSPDLIVVNDFCRDHTGLGKRYYNDCRKLFAEQCIQMTVLGGTIIHSTVIQQIIRAEPLDKEKNLGMWQPIAFFDYFAKNGVKGCSYVGNMFLPNPKAPVSSFWTRNLLWQWGERWYKMITGLPNIYHPYKADVLKVEMSDFHPFSVHFLLKARLTKGITISKVMKYHKYIPHVCNTQLWKFYMIALIPRWLVRLMEQKKMAIFRNFLKNLYLSFSGLVRR